MSQFDFGNLESPLPGSVFINGNLEPWRDALHSGHMGIARPSYVVSGMMWIDNSTTPWVLKVFQGSDDIIVGTLDPTTLVFVPSGAGVPTATNVTYSNATSGLSATNVQAAIDEVSGDLGQFIVDSGNTYQPINPRVQSVVSAATVTPTNLNDLVIITAQAVALNIANPTGTMVQGQSLIIRIKDSGAARAITWGANYRSLGVPLPSTTVINKTMYVSMIWNDTDTRFDVTGVSQEF